MDEIFNTGKEVTKSDIKYIESNINYLSIEDKENILLYIINRNKSHDMIRPCAEGVVMILKFTDNVIINYIIEKIKRNDN